jgi:hypothetical protein
MAAEPGPTANDPALALLRYLQHQGRIAADETDDEEDDDQASTNRKGGDASGGGGGGGGGGELSASDVRDALLKYMAQRGLRADPPVAHAEPIPEAETPDAAAPVVEGRFDKLWVDCDSDGRTTAVLLREVGISSKALVGVGWRGLRRAA